jgi:hypothetical protein
MMVNSISEKELIEKIQTVKALWPRIIDVTDKILFLTGGARIPALINAKDDIEEKVSSCDDSDILYSINWSIFKTLHDIAKKVDFIYPGDLSTVYLIERLKDDSHYNVT